MGKRHRSVPTVIVSRAPGAAESPYPIMSELAPAHRASLEVRMRAVLTADATGKVTRSYGAARAEKAALNLPEGSVLTVGHRQTGVAYGRRTGLGGKLIVQPRPADAPKLGGGRGLDSAAREESVRLIHRAETELTDRADRAWSRYEAANTGFEAECRTVGVAGLSDPATAARLWAGAEALDRLEREARIAEESVASTLRAATERPAETLVRQVRRDESDRTALAKRGVGFGPRSRE